MKRSDEGGVSQRSYHGYLQRSEDERREDKKYKSDKKEK